MAEGLHLPSPHPVRGGQACLQPAELLLDEACVGAIHESPLHKDALQHLAFAIGEFRDMKMRPSLETALRHAEMQRA